MALYKEYVQANDCKLMYFPVYKISQDRLERLYIRYIRSRGGFNNDPSCREFTGAFKRILLHKELHETETGNKGRVQEINSTTPGWRSLDDLDQEEAGEEEEVVMNILTPDKNNEEKQDI
ncbi:hypothetical protein J6590_083927 [Homalodisca vitripennis]|nr:hypothetical protein J6590_083927 [Homalodisca vitripennis]